MAGSNWRDKLRPGSFRGASFFVDTSTKEGGRRGPDHEFPDRDDPYAEDTGRGQRKYPVEAYVLGSDYLTAKKKLEEAIEKRGAGELIHPYHGRVRVVARTFSIRETRSDGGIARFTIQFVEAGVLKFPKQGLDAGGLLDKAASALDSAANADFGDSFSVLSAPQFIVDSATDKVNAFASKVDQVTSGVTAAAADLAELSFSVRDLKSSVRDLLGKPAELAAKMQNSLDLFKKAANPSDVIDSCKKLFGFGEDDPVLPGGTANRDKQLQNQIALNTLIQLFAVTRAASAASEAPFTSVNEAEAVRNTITDKLDSLMETTASDDVYTALQEVRARVALAVPSPDENLAKVATFTPPTTLASLVLAYDLYRTVDNEQDLIDRNKISHPGFIQGGVALEVLDNA